MWFLENGMFIMGFYVVLVSFFLFYFGVWYFGVLVVFVWFMNCDWFVMWGVVLMFISVGNFVFVDVNGFWVWMFNIFGVVGGWFLENGNIVLCNSLGVILWDSFNFLMDIFFFGLVVCNYFLIFLWEKCVENEIKCWNG